MNEYLIQVARDARDLEFQRARSEMDKPDRNPDIIRQANLNTRQLGELIDLVLQLTDRGVHMTDD